MGLWLLLALQLIATFAGFVFVWRKFQAMSGEIAALKRALSQVELAAPRRKRASGGSVVPIDTAVASASFSPALARATLNWRGQLPTHDDGALFALPTLSPETLRGLTLFVMAALPAAGFFLQADKSAIVASGLTVGAAMLLIALRPIWRTAAWAGVITAAAWTAIGFGVGAEPISFSICMTLAAASALTHAHLRRAAPGASLALIMAGACLALGSQIGMVGAPGIAFGAIVAISAGIGAMTLRLEAIHVAAFGAALIGLFVLSGQESAAIWFTPCVTWTGAWFFALAVIRVPQLGSEGAALAGTGALGPILAAGALHLSEHGLANDLAAACAFVIVGACLSGVIALSALRDQRGVAALGLTNWILALGAFVAFCSAIFIIAPAPFAAPAFAALALGLVYLDSRIREPAWRSFAALAGVLAAFAGLTSMQWFAGEAPGWAPWLLVSAGLALPAALAGATAWLAERSKTTLTAAAFETLALALGLGAAAASVRGLMSGGMPMLHPISFVETGMHQSVALAAALLLGARMNRGALWVRGVAAAVLVSLSILVSLAAAVLWLTPYWSARAEPALFNRDSIGFLAPAILYWLHWVLWRSKNVELPTRLALGAGAFSTAAFIAIEIFQARAEAWTRGADWVSVLAAAVLFALALGMNFAPGVVNVSGPRQLDLEEYLEGNRRRQERR